MNRLKALHDTAGQAPWLDYVRRDLIETGELKNLIERDGLRGVTSNPSIFEKAIGHNAEYAEAMAALQAEGDHGISALYENLAVSDIRGGADVLRQVFDATQHEDGYISLEVSPYLANNTDATIAEALRLWKTVDRPNLMVKVPATPAGVPAIRRLIGKGLNINVTLLFGIEPYENVVEAYLSGLEDLLAKGGKPATVASVASFFVSRIDTAADKKLAGLPSAASLQDKIAIANAKFAYERFKLLFAGARWERLAAAGARPQRLLWASTSTKKPELRDTLYVEQLIGRQTVNTMPPATMDAFRDHGEVLMDAVEHNLDDARATLQALTDAGVSLDDITRQLVVDGVQQFADAFDGLLGAVARRRRELSDGDEPMFKFSAGSDAIGKAYADELERWRHEGLIRRLWNGDASLWSGADEAKWLGWLPIVEQELANVAELRAFTEEVKAGGFTDVLLLGMGGSSLGPEVLAETFGPGLAGGPRFHMLDSTDPAQIKTVENAITLPTTLFIVSSKSGSTLEPNIYLSYFLALAENSLGKGKAARHFVAVTDPGSALEQHAIQQGFLYVFHGVKSIGGRYSVLSKFGLVPAAAIGIDVERLLKATQLMVRSCAEDVPPSENLGVQLGVALGVAAKSFRRDKVTLIASPGIADVGAWLEQLLAESTGKQGHGLVPVDREKLAAPEHYGTDRFFAYLELQGKADMAQRDAVAALEKAGHPVATIVVKDIWQVGGEFFRWEVATAVAGAVIGINPFDQPDVEASKIKTRALTDAYEQQGSLPEETPIFRANGISLYADKRNADALGRHNDLDGYVRSHFAQVKTDDYVALLAYVERNAAHSEIITKMRTTIRDRTKAATCVGFGPRFLHSTGQAYKGGPNSGVFLQITCDDPADLAVPDHKYSFGVVKAAQARGDLGVLEERGRRALRVHLHDVTEDLPELARIVEQVVGR